MGSAIPGNEKEITARHLVLVFLVAVVLCAVFFSLGFLVGYNERSFKAAPATERVTGPAVIPPVSPPPGAGPSRARESARGPTSAKVHAPAEVGREPSREAELVAKVESPLTAPPKASSSPEGGVAASEAAGRKAANDEVRAGFTVQVTALHTQQDAENLVSILKNRGYLVFLVAPEYAHSNDNLFRVQVGPFATRDEAEKARAKLAKEGLFKDLFIKH